MEGLCLLTALDNTFVGFKGYMTKKQCMSFCYCSVPDS